MPKFSKRSLERLNTCHPLLITLFSDVIKIINCSVICGHRNEYDQNLAYREGHSKLKWPKSKHNSKPSLAVDVIPYPCDWDDLTGFKLLQEKVLVVADFHKIAVFHGAWWNKFQDWPHWELITKDEDGDLS